MSSSKFIHSFTRKIVKNLNISKPLKIKTIDENFELNAQVLYGFTKSASEKLIQKFLEKEK